MSATDLIGKSFEYESESVHIVYVVLSHGAITLPDDGEESNGWNVLILFSDRAKRLGWAYTEGELMWVSDEALVTNEAREIGSVPTAGVR